MFIQSEIIEGASVGLPTSAFRGCSAYVRTSRPGDEGFYLIRASGPATEDAKPEVSIHLFVGDEMHVALALDRLRTRKAGVPSQP